MQTVTHSAPHNISPSSTLNVQLSAFNGIYASGFFVIKPGNTGSALRTYKSLGSGTFEIRNIENVSFFGKPKGAAYNKVDD